MPTSREHEREPDVIPEKGAPGADDRYASPEDAAASPVGEQHNGETGRGEGHIKLIGSAERE